VALELSGLKPNDLLELHGLGSPSDRSGGYTPDGSIGLAFNPQFFEPLVAIALLHKNFTTRKNT
jgi:hypothetical protein